MEKIDKGTLTIMYDLNREFDYVDPEPQNYVYSYANDSESEMRNGVVGDGRNTSALRVDSVLKSIKSMESTKVIDVSV